MNLLLPLLLQWGILRTCVEDQRRELLTKTVYVCILSGKVISRVLINISVEIQHLSILHRRADIPQRVA